MLLATMQAPDTKHASSVRVRPAFPRKVRNVSGGLESHRKSAFQFCTLRRPQFSARTCCSVRSSAKKSIASSSFCHIAQTLGDCLRAIPRRVVGIVDAAESCPPNRLPIGLSGDPHIRYLEMPANHGLMRRLQVQPHLATLIVSDGPFMRPNADSTL